MTFLNPALLWGLLALAVPVIVHFFNLRRPRTLLFSNVAFVKEVKKTVVRRVRFRQWLLLAARLLALTALVLGFAGPVLLREGQQAESGSRSVAIVIDNSYSMQAGNEKGAYFQQASSIARNLIRAYDKQDEFLVTDLASPLLNASFSGQEEALEALKDLKIEQNTRNHSDIVSFAGDIFAKAARQGRDLYLISDFQQSTLLKDSTFARSDSQIARIRYIPLATRPQNNVYISRLEVVSRIIEKDKPVNFTLDVVNDGNNNINDLSVRISLQGKVAAISTINIEAGATRKIEITCTPDASGWLNGYAEIDDTPVDFDNRRYFSLLVPEKEKVLVAEFQTSRPVHLLYEALFTQFESTLIPGKNIAAQNLGDYRSLVLLGVSDISTGLASRLKDFLDKGGSVLIFPGEGMNQVSVNAFLAQCGAGTYGKLIQNTEGLAAGVAEMDHPVFEGIFAPKAGGKGIDAPLLYKYYAFEQGAQNVQNVILKAENQTPALIETRTGSGLLYLFTTFPEDSWTDLHVKTLFSPLMLRLTQVMNQAQEVSSAQEIGNFQPLSLPAASQSLIQLQDESGATFTPEQYVRGGSTTLLFEQMSLHEGNYNIRQATGEALRNISFNIGDEESRLAYLSGGELQDKLNRRGFGSVEVMNPDGEVIARQIQVERNGKPVWVWFIIACLVFLALEVLILQWKNKPV
ncbi:MAG: VWA domain-containing protein [Bacteroidetes bacterium]|nr:MAG: VWA domain-containing protein [Bacteroidota bacterium]